MNDYKKKLFNIYVLEYKEEHRGLRKLAEKRA